MLDIVVGSSAVEGPIQLRSCVYQLGYVFLFQECMSTNFDKCLFYILVNTTTLKICNTREVESLYLIELSSDCISVVEAFAPQKSLTAVLEEKSF